MQKCLWAFGARWLFFFFPRHVDGKTSWEAGSLIKTRREEKKSSFFGQNTRGMFNSRCRHFSTPEFDPNMPEMLSKIWPGWKDSCVFFLPFEFAAHICFHAPRNKEKIICEANSEHMSKRKKPQQKNSDRSCFKGHFSYIHGSCEREMLNPLPIQDANKILRETKNKVEPKIALQPTL